MTEVPWQARLTRQILMKAWVEKELQCLWSELEVAHGNTIGNHGQIGPKWSIKCDHIAERILQASALVGPVSARNISMSRIADGWFVWANEKIGVPNPDLPTEDDLQYAREYVDTQKARSLTP